MWLEQVWPAQEQKAHPVQARAWMARVPLARALPEPGSQALRARVPVARALPEPGSRARPGSLERALPEPGS